MSPKRFFLICLLLFICVQALLPHSGHAAEQSDNRYEDRMNLYKKTETLTNVPWYYLAAVDTYERGLRKALRDRDEEKGLISIFYSPSQWAGATNPDLDDSNPLSISIFGGVGMDGDGDGIADRFNDADLLFTFAHFLEKYGFKEEDMRIALWEYYKREQSVNIVQSHAKTYKVFGTLDLHEHSFVMPLHANYSYRSTWGAKRGWGGRRIHEGTDLFAGYGVPIQSTSYGTVELIGWNNYGGWRVGIRDLDNIYHYYAHLSGFEKGIKKGDVVKPGQVVGYCGSSGYGKPGTQGKFPPHLHYGMYRDNGVTEWSFDPYPLLKSWERQAYKNKKKS